MTKLKNQLIKFAQEVNAKHGKNGVWYTRVEMTETSYNVALQNDLILDGECWNVEGLDFKKLTTTDYTETIATILDIFEELKLNVANDSGYVNGLLIREFKNGRLVA